MIFCYLLCDLSVQIFFWEHCKFIFLAVGGESLSKETLKTFELKSNTADTLKEYIILCTSSSFDTFLTNEGFEMTRNRRHVDFLLIDILVSVYGHAVCRWSRRVVLSGGMTGFPWFPVSGAEWRVTVGSMGWAFPGADSPGPLSGGRSLTQTYTALDHTFVFLSPAPYYPSLLMSLFHPFDVRASRFSFSFFSSPFGELYSWALMLEDFSDVIMLLWTLDYPSNLL